MCTYVRCTTVLNVGLTLGWKSKHSPGDNGEINGLQRWRFVPMSDIFSFIRSNSDKIQIIQHMAQTYYNQLNSSVLCYSLLYLNDSYLYIMKVQSH